MSRPSDSAQGDRPVAEQEADETQYIGTTTPGTPIHNANEHTLFGVETDERTQRLEPIGDTVASLSDEPLGDAANRVGEELGWSSLSEFGERESQGSE